jgi:hypothetical protein
MIRTSNDRPRTARNNRYLNILGIKVASPTTMAEAPFKRNPYLNKKQSFLSK